MHRDAWKTFTFRQFIVYEEDPRPEFVLHKLVEVGTSNLAAAVLGRLGRPTNTNRKGVRGNLMDRCPWARILAASEAREELGVR